MVFFLSLFSVQFWVLNNLVNASGKNLNICDEKYNIDKYKEYRWKKIKPGKKKVCLELSKKVVKNVNFELVKIYGSHFGHFKCKYLYNSDFITTHEEYGYVSIADFVKNSVRKNLESYKKNLVKILDNPQ